MDVNADLTKRALVNSEEIDWISSPQSGVDRRMLDRQGDEVARATTIVRFAPHSRFPSHVHGGGEEFFVLGGVFSDESGDYGPGMYVRNPVGSKHQPHSDPGATIFVKLQQMAPGDQDYVRIDTNNTPWQAGSVEGLRVIPLHQFEGERTLLIDWQPGVQFEHHDHPGGEEVLVLDGVLEDEDGRYPKGTWIRYPVGSSHTPFSNEGCRLFVKIGHL